MNVLGTSLEVVGGACLFLPLPFTPRTAKPLGATYTGGKDSPPRTAGVRVRTGEVAKDAAADPKPRREREGERSYMIKV